MKPRTKKEKFIMLRAEGLSYDNICKEIGIGKTTAKRWNDELQDKIEVLEAERMQELYSLYRMHKEQRIKDLGKLLQGVDNALANADFSSLSVRSLLGYKLRFTAELAKLYTPKDSIKITTNNISPVDIMEALAKVFNETTDNDQKRAILDSITKVYETIVQQAKIDELEGLLNTKTAPKENRS